MSLEPKLVEVEFQPEKEAWSVYEISDGSVVRLKCIMLKLFRLIGPTGQDMQPNQYNAAFQNIVTVKANSRLKGPPNATPLTPEQINAAPRIDLEFTPLTEDWNVYRVETGDSLKVKLVATLVQRLRDSWDVFGDPNYLVQSTNVIQPVKKPDVQ